MLDLAAGLRWIAGLIMPLSTHFVNKPSPYELIWFDPNQCIMLKVDVNSKTKLTTRSAKESGPDHDMHLRDVCVAQASGSSMSQQQRTQIDAIAAHIASTAGLAIDQISQSFEGNSSQAGNVAIQLAALKALLASVLCPAPHRPSFLPQALTLFTQVRTATAIEMTLLGVSTTSSRALLPC